MDSVISKPTGVPGVPGFAARIAASRKPKSDEGAGYLPTQAEIREACLKIQTRWTETERIARSTFFDSGTLHATINEVESRGYEVPTVALSEAAWAIDN